MTAAAKLDRAISFLEASTLRRTVPRLMVLKTLADAEQPMTVDEVHERVGKRNCNFVTVYRVLDTFDSVGLVSRYFRGNGASLFALNLGDSEAHVIDRDTHKVYPVDDPEMIALKNSIKRLEANLALRGFTGISPVFQFFASVRPKQDSEESPPGRYGLKPSSLGFIERQLAAAIQRMERPAKAQ